MCRFQKYMNFNNKTVFVAISYAARVPSIGLGTDKG